MIVFELTNTEHDPLYQNLEISNGNRQYDFLKSIVGVALGLQRTFLSQAIIKSLNYHAIACLHTNAGEFRPCPVEVGDYIPIQHYRVQAAMDDFINTVNLIWDRTDAVVLASFVLWRLNNIHPFINGNGRTARAAAYYVLCIKNGGWIDGDPILPTLIKENRQEYVDALKEVDASQLAGALTLRPLHALLTRLLEQQLGGVPNGPSASTSPP